VALEQLQPVLDLGDAELELVELVAGHEVELRDERAHRLQRLLGEPRAAAAHARRQLHEELLEDVDDPLATARGHAASCDGAAAASRAAPAHPAPTGPPARRRRAPASARSRARAPTARA